MTLRSIWKIAGIVVYLFIARPKKYAVYFYYSQVHSDPFVIVPAGVQSIVLFMLIKVIFYSFAFLRNWHNNPWSLH